MRIFMISLWKCKEKYYLWFELIRSVIIIVNAVKLIKLISFEIRPIVCNLLPNFT